MLPGLWSGRVLTDPGATSGWHHHGAHDTVAYVVAGVFAVETADGVVEADAGRLRPHPAARRAPREQPDGRRRPRWCWSGGARARSSSTSTRAVPAPAQL